PIYSPEIEDVEPSALRLSWRQPSVAKKSKATYSVEMLEPSTWKWRPLVSRLPHPSYKVSNIEPTKDYLFRVRAEVDSVITEPSFSISFSNRREFTKPVAKTKALPTVPVERPTLSDVYDDSVRVNWHPTSYHGANRKNLPQAYRLEVRELPDSYWRTLVPYTDQSSYEVTDLRPNQDYAFRVRTVTDTGMSEPSLPVYHYRQAATPKFPLPSPEIADIGDDYISLGWKLVDIPAFDVDETPLSFMIEAQKLPDYDWRPVARGVTGMSHKVTGLEPRQDYNFRLRGETPVGVTQPSLPTSLYRRPLVSGVPIANMSVDRDSTQPYAAQLRWSPAYIQPYKTTRDLKYQIEVQEPHHSDWSLVARDIPTTTYTVPELSPRKDYLFRIKAQLPTGSLSAPTTPIPFYRLSAAPSPQPALTFPTEDYSSINRPYIESLILKVPPRMSIEKPEMTVLSPDTVRLNWKSARVPAATANISPTTYRVEVRHEDSFEWMERATRIPGLTTDIKGLNPHIDYAFRVRAVNDFGWSESTLPVFLHRPQDYKDTSYDQMFEPIETYTSLLGDTAPPKMPIDTPRMGLVQGTTMRLSWTPARIPLYARKTPITYLIEKKEPHDQDWVMIASQLDDTAHTIPNIKPEQDYLFRVRAENEFGISEATLPAALTRSKTPHFIRSSASRERELDIGGNKWSSTYSYIDSVSSGGKQAHCL
uniref:Fibronectin type-III domain-containing protein n=1 Tax=Biomphalaria glabrata TaxID=6526 RepID=A0A2C9LRF5_BIOGL